MDRSIDEERSGAVTTDEGNAPREIELKLFVPPSSAERLWRHPLLGDHAGPAASEVESRYFDTADGLLAARRMALRLRHSEGRWVQTLKVAGDDERALSTRGEWESNVAGPALELALLADTPLAALGPEVGARLRPVFSTVFRRETKGIELDGSTVEFAFDVGEVRAGRGKAARALPICEVEIEVKRGPTPDLLRFAARLAKDLPLIPLADSKAERGHRLLVGDGRLEAHRVELPVARPHDTPHEHLAHVLAAGNRTLLANAHALFEIGGDIDAKLEFVHQARIAVRRMRSALRTFEPVVDDRRERLLSRRLGGVGRAFGDARDQDVFATVTLAHVERQVAIDDEGRRAMVALRDVAASRRIEAHAALMRHLDAGEFGAVTIAVERAIVRLERAAAKDRATLAKRAPRWLGRQMDRIVPLARRIACLDDVARHGLRIEVKRLRYALDLFAGLYPAEAVDDYRDALAALQDKLGKINDAAVAAHLLHAWTAETSNSVVAARFDAWREDKLRKQLPQVASLAVTLELVTPPWRLADRDRPLR